MRVRQHRSVLEYYNQRAWALSQRGEVCLLTCLHTLTFLSSEPRLLSSEPRFGGSLHDKRLRRRAAQECDAVNLPQVHTKEDQDQVAARGGLSRASRVDDNDIVTVRGAQEPCVVVVLGAPSLRLKPCAGDEVQVRAARPRMMMLHNSLPIRAHS